MNKSVNTILSVFFIALTSVMVSCKKKDDVDMTKAFVKYYGGLNANYGVDVKQTSNDGGYILAGTTTGTGSDIIIIKTNAEGNEIWNKTFGGPNHDVCGSVSIMPDGGYLLVGTYGLTAREWNINTLEATKDSTILYAIRLDQLGNVQWEKKYPYSNPSVQIGTIGKSAVVNGDGTCLIAGMVDSSYVSGGNILVNLDVFAFIIDDATNGEILKVLNTATSSYVDMKPLRYGVNDKNDFTYGAIKAISNDEYIISSSTILGTGTNPNTPRIIRCRLNGIALLQNNAPTKSDWIENTLYDGAQIATTYDNHYLLTGTSGLSSTPGIFPTSSNGYILKLEPISLSKVGYQTIGTAGDNKEVGVSITSTSDGGCITLGTTNNILLTGGAEKLDDVVLSKYDGNLTLQWQKVFGGRGNDLAAKVIETSDGGYLICGTIAFGDDISNSGSSNVLSLIKVNNAGDISNVK